MTRKPSATPGLLLVVLGVLALAMALPPFSFGTGALVTGAVLILGGGTLLVLRHFHRVEVVQGLVPAHEAFRKREPVVRIQKEDMDELRIPDHIPEVGDVEDVSMEDLEIHALDVRIKHLDEKLNRATVLLGTKRLSQDGYRRYVEDIRKEKADLEARRLHLQMGEGRVRSV